MYTYLLIDLCSIAIPLAWSFESKLQFYRQWRHLFPALALTGAFFIVWDIYFTRWEVWGFNPAYLSGHYLLHLPLEEWLFFICIPYSCVFTYVALGYFIEKDHFGPYAGAISWFLIAGSVVLAFFNMHRAYTFSTFSLLAVLLLLHVLVLKSGYLGRFYFSYLFILIPFFIVNGLLTGSFIPDEVVWYNDRENLSLRMHTIPVEDTFYGMSLILINVTLFEWFRSKTRRP